LISNCKKHLDTSDFTTTYKQFTFFDCCLQMYSCRSDLPASDICNVLQYEINALNLELHCLIEILYRIDRYGEIFRSSNARPKIRGIFIDKVMIGHGTSRAFS